MEGDTTRMGLMMVLSVIGIIAVIVVFGAFIQVGLLSHERTDTYMRATQEAATFAVQPQFDPDQPPEPYVLSMLIGDDLHTYSADDRRVGSSGDEVISGILTHTLPQDLVQYAPDSAFSRITGGSDLNGEFSMVRGDATSRGIRLLPVVRNLIYRADRIDIDAEVVSIWTRGIY